MQSSTEIEKSEGEAASSGRVEFEACLLGCGCATELRCELKARNEIPDQLEVEEAGRSKGPTDTEGRWLREVLVRKGGGTHR